MTKHHSTPRRCGRNPTGQKPEKPYPDFPLTVNPCGYYSKKFRGKVHYFGRWDEGPEVALQRYNERREDLEAAGACRDTEALYFAMGHKLPGMASEYVKNIQPDRLQAVAETVRRWLFGE